MKKEQLLEEFLENRIIISKIYKEYKNIIDYYNKQNWYWYNFKSFKIIFDFIESNYYQFLINDEINIKQWIENIKDYNYNDYIFELIDIDDEIILELYSVFQRYTDYCEDDFDNLAILSDAQYSWFEDLLWSIKKEFIKFLEGKM